MFTGKLVPGLGDTSPTPSSSAINLDLVTSDQYVEAYIDRLFSDNGPVAELENYFIKAGDNTKLPGTALGSKNETGVRNEVEQSDRVQRADSGRDEHFKREEGGEKVEKCEQRGDSLKLSIVETQPHESLDHSLHGASSTAEP